MPEGRSLINLLPAGYASGESADRSVEPASARWLGRDFFNLLPSDYRAQRPWYLEPGRRFWSSVVVLVAAFALVVAPLPWAPGHGLPIAAASHEEFCFLVADGGNTLTSYDFVSGSETIIGPRPPDTPPGRDPGAERTKARRPALDRTGHPVAIGHDQRTNQSSLPVMGSCRPRSRLGLVLRPLQGSS